ncbi:MAG: chemotaxis protein CheD [Chloroflexota bacterium]|nr:chemotaxis protein CheD [Chloroflexota bacterium]
MAIVLSPPHRGAVVTPNATMVGLGEVRAIKAALHSTDMLATDMLATDMLATETLVAYGLGSCVAICLFDAASKVVGMAHVVLPGTDPAGAPNAKYARSALPELMARMQRLGAGDPRRYVARLAGGAHILSLGGSGSLPRIGLQNAIAVQESLKATGIPVRATDLGGSKGRTVWFNPGEGGQIRVRTIGSAERRL